MSIETIKTLARLLRFRPLNNVIGKEVIISGLDELYADLNAALVPHLPHGCRLDNYCGLCGRTWIPLPLLKYGVLDLTYEAPARLLETDYMSGIPVLRHLGILYDSPGSPGYAVDEEMGEHCLEVLAKQVLGNRACFRLFLHTASPMDLAWAGTIPFPQDGRFDSMPDGYLPRCFVVSDACVPNAQSAWMSKHFYM
jgi:hypothetical protein